MPRHGRNNMQSSTFILQDRVGGNVSNKGGGMKGDKFQFLPYLDLNSEFLISKRKYCKCNLFGLGIYAHYVVHYEHEH